MKQRDLILIAVFTFITVVAWIIFGVYHTRVTSTITPALQQRIEPIEPRFDTRVIDSIKNERKQVLLLPEVLPSPIASPSPTASPSSNL